MSTKFDSTACFNWLEKAISEDYIKYYDIAKFTNRKEISCGHCVNIAFANWRDSDTVIVLKYSCNSNVKEIVNKVNYYNNDNYKNAVVSFNKAADNGFIRGNDFNENLGFAYIYSGEFEKGETLLNEIVARKPGDKELLRDISTAFYESKMYDKCLDYCQKLMEMDMKDGKALYQAGLCFQKMGQKDKGQAMCDQAIELDPSLAGKRQKQMTGF